MTIAQLAVSGLGMVFSIGGAVLLWLAGGVGLFSESAAANRTTGLFSLAWICLFAALLAAPSLFYSIQRLSGRRLPELRGPANGFRLATLLLPVWALVLALGNAISGQAQLAWLILPVLQILAVGIPAWWLIEFARRGLFVGSKQRGWGVINFSIFITTPMIMLVEIIVIIILVVAFAVWVSANPALLNSLQALGTQLANAQANPEAIMRLLAPYIENPWVMAGSLAVAAVLIPLIEELFKPLAIWLLVGRRLTPAEGFVAGALCGGAFGMIESLFYLSSPGGQSWAALAFGRTGTELLHISTTALVGWALASAWQNRTYFRLFLFYLAAAGLHGLWNGLSIVSAFGDMQNAIQSNLSLLPSIAKVAPYGIGFVALVLLFNLWWVNLQLRREPPAVSGSIDPPNIPA
jgi:hypothetical protein